MDKPSIAYCWVDMETTGLDAYSEVPLEVALILSDEWGNQVDQCSYLVHDGTSAFKDKIGEAIRHPIVGPMHEKSGLWHDLDTREMLTDWGSIYDVDLLLVKFLKKNNVESGTVPMAGNSIGSLDRPFAQAHFPQFNKYLHYRNVDVSTIKEICRRINPELYKALEPTIGKKEDATHRALDDARASIVEYCEYVDNFFFVE